MPLTEPELPPIEPELSSTSAISTVPAPLITFDRAPTSMLSRPLSRNSRVFTEAPAEAATSPVSGL